jgi:hypothetical protein
MTGPDLFLTDWSAQEIGVVGVQPLIGGVVLASELGFARKSSGSLGTGKSSNGSLGTGRSSNGSLGTGRSEN